jgi:hypothetical protein
MKQKASEVKTMYLTLENNNFDKTIIKENFYKVFSLAPNSSDNWYLQAYLQIRLELFNLSMLQATGIVACLSPQLSWSYNIQSAKYFVDLYQTFDFKLLSKYTFQSKSNLKKCYDILDCDNEYQVLSVLRTPKVSNFFLNLLHPNDVLGVTIDSHMINASGVKHFVNGGFVNNHQYHILADCVMELSNQIHILPQILQATIWLNIKNFKNKHIC